MAALKYLNFNVEFLIGLGALLHFQESLNHHGF